MTYACILILTFIKVSVVKLCHIKTSVTGMSYNKAYNKITSSFLRTLSLSGLPLLVFGTLAFIVALILAALRTLIFSSLGSLFQSATMLNKIHDSAKNVC